MDVFFSFIIPVYNRPQEIAELLESVLHQTFTSAYEIVIVEDGSSETSENIVAHYTNRLDIQYLKKSNTGPGDSRNYGMKHAKGNYFIVLDSDCILPPQYLDVVNDSLQMQFVHCFGGPDAAHSSFSKLQKAINYAMTSVLTTGGIRGRKAAVDKFQPRSFNMGISKIAFEATGGYGNIHPGEDPDLTIRIWEKGYTTKLITKAFVYHKRRIDWDKFYKQVYKFGTVRPILNHWHPHTKKLTYWFPSIFCIGFIFAVACAFTIFQRYAFIFAGCYMLYFGAVFFESLIKNKNLHIAVLSVVAVIVQFAGYGYGFLKATIKIGFSRKSVNELFPRLFFKTTSVL